jgi:two-component sensor histidine kinase/streptogramin lyase
VETGPPEPPYRFEPESPGLVSGAVLFDRAGRLWLHPPAPARIDEAARRIALPPGDRSGFAPSAILEDRSGTLWFGNHLGGGILRVWPDGTAAAQPVDPAGGWLPNAVRAILEDRSGAIWLGTLGGLYRHDPNAKPFRCVAHDKTDPNSLSDSAVSSLWEAPDGVLWIGTFGGGLNRWDRATERVSRFRARAGDRSRLRHDIVWAVEGDRGGRIWLATEDGLCSLEPGSGRFTWHDLPGLTRGPGLTRLSKLAVDEAGTLWVGSPNGVHAVETGTGAVRRSFFIAPGEGGRHLVVDSLLADGQGGFWMGSGAHGLLLRRLDPETGIGEEHALLGRDGRPLSAEGIWMIHRDRRGRLWLATGVGLSRFDPRSGETTHYFERDGLPGAIVYGILEDAGGRLWLSTDRGLSVFDERAEAQRRFRNFDSSDGICGNEFNRGAALRSRSGEFVFGGLDGLTIFDPQAIRDNPYVPPVQLTGIEVWGRGGTRAIAPYGLERLTLPWHDDSFALSFAALSFGAAEKSRYAYRLEGLDRDWVEAGGHRQARYTNVPPGRYTFRVKGASPDGVWNHEGATVAITLTPPFWQRLWFRGLMFGMLVGMAYAGHRYRVAKLLEMERLRLRIASDLHDDLSSDLSAIAMVTDMMQRRSELAEPERSRLAELRDKALEMAGSLRDVVWYVQPEHDTLEAIVRRMRTTAASLLGDTSCSFEIDLPGERGGVHMATRRNLFLIYKELIHNVARHAGATSVSVSLKAEDGRLLLRVRDDGKGFDATASHAGEGLRSVRRRAQQIGAALEIVSRPGQGTEVRLTMDLARTRDARRRRDLL